jgi:hypothetical protein
MGDTFPGPFSEYMWEEHYFALQAHRETQHSRQKATGCSAPQGAAIGNLSTSYRVKLNDGEAEGMA